jgi:D-sedoheptulose 7-phosphate isomerase
MSNEQHILNALNEAKNGLESLIKDTSLHQAIDAAASAMCTAISEKGRIFSCGNGGSMCDAMHFAEELTGRYRLDRPAFPAIAISDPSHIACVGNDYGYQYIFSRYLEAHGQPGDVLLAISTSGSSKNVIEAAKTAKSRNLKIVALTGKKECPLADLSDIHIPTPVGSFADRIQELHIKVIHILIELIERRLSPTNYR